MKKLFLTLLLACLAGSIAARADNVPAAGACTPHGVNLMEELEAKDPASWQELQREADKVPNRTGLLWKIEKEGIEPSYLFGTIHFSDPRVMTLPKATDAAYRSANTVVVETTDMLDPKFFLRVRLEHPDLLLFTDGTTLKSHLPAEQRDEIERKLARRGRHNETLGPIQPADISKMRETAQKRGRKIAR